MVKEGLVSVITPMYNAAEYLALTIESVLRQTYPEWELILIDDCSEDDTLKIAKYAIIQVFPWIFGICINRSTFEPKNLWFLIMAQETRNVDHESMVEKYMNEWDGWGYKLGQREGPRAILDSDDLWLSQKMKE